MWVGLITNFKRRSGVKKKWVLRTGSYFKFWYIYFKFPGLPYLVLIGWRAEHLLVDGFWLVDDDVGLEGGDSGVGIGIEGGGGA